MGRSYKPAAHMGQEVCELRAENYSVHNDSTRPNSFTLAGRKPGFRLVETTREPVHNFLWSRAGFRPKKLRARFRPKK